MKKILFLTLTFLLGTQHISAQDDTAEYGIFNHLGAAVSVGTDGIGFDVASPLTNYVALRAALCDDDGHPGCQTMSHGLSSRRR